MNKKNRASVADVPLTEKNLDYLRKANIHIKHALYFLENMQEDSITGRRKTLRKKCLKVVSRASDNVEAFIWEDNLEHILNAPSEYE